MERAIYRNNKRLYGVFSVLNSAMPIWFVFLLYLLSKGMNYTEAILLDSFSAFTAILFEVPSGIMADKMSRKKVLILGEMIQLFNFILLFLFDTYIIFVIGAILSGIGTAFVSGTGEAFIYDIFAYNEEVEAYKPFMGHIKKWSFVAVAVVSLCAGFLFKIWAGLPMGISILLLSGALLCLLLMREQRQATGVESNEAEAERHKNKWRQEIQKQLEIIQRFFKKAQLVKLLLLEIVLLVVISNINYTTQAYLPEIGIDVKYLGVALCIFNIISAFGAKYTEKAKVNGLRWISAYIAILLLLSTGNLILVMLALCASRFIGGFVFTVLSVEQNKEIASEERATVLSVIGLFMDISPLLIDPLLGIVYDHKGFQFAFLLLAMLLTAIGFVLKIKAVQR